MSLSQLLFFRKKGEPMTFEDAYFKKKVLKPDSLEPFGFTATEQGYEFRKPLIAEELEAQLLIDSEGKLTGQVVDIDLNEPYDTFRSSQATGTYVGQVREAYGELLSQVADSCYEDQLFSSPQANRLARFLVQEFSDQADRPFEKEPSYLSFRVAGKWYALLFPLKGEKLGLSGAKADLVYDVVNLKVDPKQMDQLMKMDGIFPSYHMSKKTWISLVLDDTLPDQTVFELLRNSRSLVAPKHLRKASEPHYWLIPANLKYYDIGEEFSASAEILWTQKASMQKGDLVAIYITAPTKAIRYLCQVLEANIPNQGYREEESIKELMRIKPLYTFNNTDFDSDRLKSLGIKTVRGPRHMTEELVQALSPYLKEK